jgi:predicted DCC family thiol-disulfide oxidoreductase YuxK
LQSDFAKVFLKKHGVDANDLDTVIFYSNNRIYTRSSAILEIAKHLGGIYKILPVFSIVPPFLRDAVYKLIAKNRYKFFGKKESCRIPTAEERSYFID